MPAMSADCSTSQTMPDTRLAMIAQPVNARTCASRALRPASDEPIADETGATNAANSNSPNSTIAAPKCTARAATNVALSA